MRARFWGTRGGFAAPGAAFRRYGGNTICIEVVSDDGGRLIIDMGTGCIALGALLMQEAAAGRASRRFAVVLSHTQIDHIQGLPFFAPALMQGWEITMLGPSTTGRDLAGILDSALNPNYSPLYSVENLTPKIEFVTLTEGDLAWDGIRIRTRELPHGAARSLGFRVEADGASLAVVPDVSYDGIPPAAALDLASEVDALVHDGSEPVARRPELERSAICGCSPDQALAVAREAEAKKLVLYHHDPDATDVHLDQTLARVRAKAAGLSVDAAREGEWLVLRG